MNIVLQGAQLLLSVIEVGLTYEMVKSFSKEKQDCSQFLQLVFCLCFGVIIDLNKNIRLFSITILIFLILCIALSSKILYRIKLGLAFLITTIYVLGTALLDLFVVFSLGLMLRQEDFGTQIGRNLNVQRIIAMLITRTILVAIYCFFKQTKRNIFIDDKKQKYLLAMLAVLEIISIAIFHSVYVYNILTDLASYWFMCIALITITGALFIFYVMYRNRKESEIVISQRMQLLEYNYQNVLAHYQQSARVFHDFKNHLFVINELVCDNEIEEALSYIDNIAEPFRMIRRDVLSGNRIIDLVLNYKIYESSKLKIKLDIDVGQIERSISIKDSELCALLSNILDNAIEACKKIQDCQKRVINLTIKQRQSMLFIKAVNNIASKPVFSGRKMITTKKDKKAHGIGFSSIQDIVKAHSGKIEYHFTECIFVLEIAISC